VGDEKGVAKHPDWYLPLTADSSFEDFQRHLHSVARLSDVCPEPCTADLGADACHTSVQGEACYEKVSWAMQTGVVKHPEWYGNLNKDSSFEDFQLHLHSSARLSSVCPKPCFAPEAARVQASEETGNFTDSDSQGRAAPHPTMAHPEPLASKFADDFHKVLIIGSSVDRYALSSNYRSKYGHNVVIDEPRNVGIAVLQHLGVGLHGDLDGPFWTPAEAHGQYVPTYKTIAEAPAFAHDVFGPQPPDLVVVESSLWDLAGWWQITRHHATPERLEQWCDKDLPYLLENVTRVFNQSRVVFRTAPQVAPWNNVKWTQADLEAMHECVLRRSAGTGEVFEHVGVIDYHEIMDNLIATTAQSRLQDLWRPDGYHPAALPGRLYLNQIFGLLGGVQPL